MTAEQQTTDASVQRSITVRTNVERAFRIFTEGFDTWWPRSHHIGNSPMRRAIIEPFVGGRCYAEQVDGTDCPWGQVITWDPPHRLVFAWQITHEWSYEPDLARSSEVDVRFTPQPDGSTRVDLEHRGFDRMGPAGASMRTAVESSKGWGDLLQLFAARVETAN